MNSALIGERRPVVPSTHVNQAILVVGLLALWTMTHRFLSLMLDGELYAFQALSRIHPSLAGDLYLANTSQDQFTCFSAIYAAAIRLFGLQAAGCILFGVFRAAYLAGAWLLMFRLTSNYTAWLTVAALVCVVSPYGAYGVFESASDYLTARTLAEALVVVAMAIYFYSRALAIPVLAVAFTMHPLMTLPGVLLLICLSTPVRLSMWMFAIGILGVGAIASTSTSGLIESRSLVVMDPAWLEVVRERSQFLFLEYWRLNDWERQARPFVTLALAYACVSTPPVRKLCVSAGIVGVSGLLVAAIAGSIGPVAILLQGQAWRWMWVTGFVAITVAVPAAEKLWHSNGSGRLCSLLLVAGWAFPPADGTACVTGAFVLWLLNSGIPAHRQQYLQYASYTLILIMGLWAAHGVFVPEISDSEHASGLVRLSEYLRAAFSIQVLALSLFAGAAWLVVRGHPARWAIGALATALIAMSLPTILSGSGVQAVDDQKAVAVWRNVIPESSSVLLLPLRKTASFPWFTLTRPSYLSLTQSAGVVFSSATAAEVKRRSEVLAPVADPDWRLLTHFRAVAQHQALPEPDRPLTAQALSQVCADPSLDFVVAREAVGFHPVVNTAPGRWKDWNLYDCRNVRSG